MVDDRQSNPMEGFLTNFPVSTWTDSAHVCVISTESIVKDCSVAGITRQRRTCIAMGARVTRELLKINRIGLNRAELTVIQHNFFELYAKSILVLKHLMASHGAISVFEISKLYPPADQLRRHE